MENQKKQQYIMPEVTVVDVAVENGFAQSTTPATANTVNASSMDDIQIDF